MTLSDFVAEFEKLASRPHGSVGGQDALDSFPGWDSLALIEFMSMADAKLGVQLEPAQVSACTTVNDLAVLCGVAP